MTRAWDCQSGVRRRKAGALQRDVSGQSCAAAAASHAAREGRGGGGDDWSSRLQKFKFSTIDRLAGQVFFSSRLFDGTLVSLSLVPAVSSLRICHGHFTRVACLCNCNHLVSHAS